MRILVEISDRLGEVVCDIALMRTIVAGLPESSIEVVCKDHMSGVIEDCYFIQYRNVLSKGNLSGFLSTNLRIATSKWDVYIQTAEDSSLELARLVFSAPYVRGPEHRNEVDVSNGMMIHRLSVLEGLVPNWRERIVTEIPLLEGRAEHAMRVVGLEKGARLLTVAPGSSTGASPWSRDRCLPVIKELAERFDKILVLGRIADRAHCQWLAKEVSGTAIAGDLPLPYALALFTMARLHIGTDNCMAQTAAAFGVPTVSVGGPSDCYTKPWQQSMIPGSPEEIKPDEVIATAIKAME